MATLSYTLYVNIMPDKLQNTIYLYRLNNFNLLLIIHSLNVLIYLEKFSQFLFGTPAVFLHTQIVNTHLYFAIK